MGECCEDGGNRSVMKASEYEWALWIWSTGPGLGIGVFLEEHSLLDAELRFRFAVVTLLDDTSSWNDK